MILPFDAPLRHHGPGSIIKSTPAGMKRAANIAARLATEGIAEAILVEEVRFSALRSSPWVVSDLLSVQHAVLP
jgi:hypothetical protein